MKPGFTIVELLIALVVIAVLASISVVTYSGTQQRAKNAKILAAANQVHKSISGYIATNGSYPTNNSYCIVSSESTCTAFGATRSTDSTLISNLKTIGSLPGSIPITHTDWNGITTSYNSGATYSGASRPLRIAYGLLGEQQKCGIGDVSNTGGITVEPSTNGYTSSSGGITICVISIAAL